MFIKKELIKILETNKDLYNKHYKKTNKKFLSALLAKRNIKNIEDLSLSNLSNPFNFPEIIDFSKKIDNEIKTRPNKVILHTDYDSDGINSNYIFKHFCRLHYNKEIATTLNDRQTEGYGLTVPVVEKLHKQGFEVIITADNGISSIEAIERAKELGIKVYITDHHEPKRDENNNQILPDCDIIDHKIANVSYYGKEWCGCATLWFILKIINPKISEKFLEAVGIATLGDMVSLTSIDNKILVKEALKRVNEDNFSSISYRNFFKTIFDDNSKYGAVDKKTYFEEDFGFTLVPIINATGRLNIASEFINELNKEEGKDFTKFVYNNTIRKDKTKKFKELALSKREEYQHLNFIVVVLEDVEDGIIGLIASDLEKRFLKPTIVFGEKEHHFHGSGRAVNFDLQKIFHPNFGIELKGGGHKAACGLSIEKNKINDFILKLQKEEIDKYTLEIDGILQSKHINFDLFNEMNEMSPFGQDFEKPKFIIKGEEIESFTFMKDGHLKVILNSGTSMVLFFFYDEFQHSPFKEKISLENKDEFLKLLKSFEYLGNLNLNIFNGKKSLQIIVDKIIY